MARDTILITSAFEAIPGFYLFFVGAAVAKSKNSGDIHRLKITKLFGSIYKEMSRTLL